MADRRRSSLLEFLLIFAIVYFGTQFVMNQFFPQPDPNTVQTPIVLEAVPESVKGGHHPSVRITNNTNEEFALLNRCPQPPVDVYLLGNTVASGSTRMLLSPTSTVLPCPTFDPIAAGKRKTIDLAPWKYSVFADESNYEMTLPNPNGSGSVATTTVSYYEAGTVTKVFRTFVTKPLLNLLVFIASLLPDYNLGWAIILLTLIIKIALFFPTQSALESQKKMQVLQPKLEALKKKYKDNPQRMQQETMKLWKEEKINPFQSCLPMLLQFPILIGLFFVIRDGSMLELSQHLLYETYQNLPWSFGTTFLGLDLLKSNAYIMAPLLVVMQYTQMKLSFTLKEKKQAQKQGVIDVGSKKKKKSNTAETPDVQALQQKMMLYGLPIMIGVFAFQFPSAVSLYWAISTIFAIGQQLVVNKRT